MKINFFIFSSSQIFKFFVESNGCFPRSLVVSNLQLETKGLPVQAGRMFIIVVVDRICPIFFMNFHKCLRCIQRILLAFGKCYHFSIIEVLQSSKNICHLLF